MAIDEPCGLDFRALSRLADELVMSHLQSGHDDALAVIFDRFHRLVYNVALKILRDPSEAEDVMQSVFLEIYKVAAQFDAQRGTAKVWILQYAYHRSINRRQQLIARKFYDSVDIEQVQEILASPDSSPPATHEARQLIKQALETLKPVQRRVLQLAYFEGLSLKEIADETGESLGNVRHHYYRGLAKLRAVVTQEGLQRQAIGKEIVDART